MSHKLISSFAVRLRDVLATLESSALIGAAEARVRGLAEQLQFACLALPCAEALAALELARLGRLRVPGVASADGWRASELEFPPSGTPFAYLLGGGTGYSAELTPDDPMLSLLAPVLQSQPTHALFVPVRVGTSVMGGVALLFEDNPSEEQLTMAERLSEVLALTLEAYRTERVLLALFAAVLPDLCSPDAPTGFTAGLEKYIHRLRITPEYRRRIELAEVVGRIAANGPAETRLVGDILGRVDGYVKELGTLGDEGGEASYGGEAAYDDGAYDELSE